MGSCGWRPDAFLGFIIWISHEFLGCTMNLVLCMYFRMLLDRSFFRSGLRTCAIERKMDLSLQAHALGDFQILNNICSLMCLILIESDFEFVFAFYLFYCSQLKHVQSWTFWTSECSFVSLRMICKTNIWCNQILMVKQRWKVAIVTSRMILSLECS